MYFTDISNEELQTYQKEVIDTFSISLTDALTSSLFKIETISVGSIYKIYPLFYCDKITSSNKSDKVLENKCIIVNKTDTETYLKFNNILDDENKCYYNLREYYEIGDTLTMEDFNAYIQFLRDVNVSETIQINNLNTTYGDYEFNINGTVLDNGILITNNTNITATLKNPVFKNSTYTLKLQALNITDVNLMDNIHKHLNYKTVTVDLIEDKPVEIPLTNLDEEDVILFNAEIHISHDKPVLILPDNITLEATGSMIVTETMTLTATYTKGGLGVNNKTISFYDGATLLGTAQTNSDGVAVYTYTPSTVKTSNFKAVYEHVESNIETITIMRIPSTITLTGKTQVYVDDSLTLTGTLKDKTDNARTGVTVNLYDGNAFTQMSATTDNEGGFSFTPLTNLSRTSNFRVQSAELGNYSDAQSNLLSVTIQKAPVNISLSVTREDNENIFTVTGLLTDYKGTVLSNVSLGHTASDGSGTVTTGEDGSFTFTKTFNTSGYETITVTLPSNNRKYVSTSKSVTVLSKRTPEFTNIQRTKNGSNYIYSAFLVCDGEGLVGKNVTGKIGNDDVQDILTGSGGGFVFVRTTASSFKVTFAEDNEFIGCEGEL